MKKTRKNSRRIDLRVPDFDVARWQIAADAEEMTLSAWIRYACGVQVEARETIVKAKRTKRT